MSKVGVRTVLGWSSCLLLGSLLWLSPVEGDVKLVFAPPLLRSIQFTDETTGWTSGYRGVFHTRDAGRTWAREPVEVGAFVRLGRAPTYRDTGSILWLDSKHLVVRSDQGLIVKDIRADRWGHIRLTPEFSRKLLLFAFSDSSAGWAVGTDAIYRTTDGGLTWSSVKVIPDPYRVRRIRSPRSDQVWLVGLDGLLLGSTDNGRSWVRRDLPKLDFADIQLLGDRGFLCGWFGQVYGTWDGGVTWAKQGPRLDADLETIFFRDPNEGWAAGEGAVYHTCDGAATWRRIDMKALRQRFVQIHGKKAGQAWAVTLEGSVIHFVDHGNSWRSVSLP